MDYKDTDARQETVDTLPLKLDVTVRPVTPKNGLIAVASVKFNDCFVVSGVKIIAGNKGLFVDMPSIPDGTGNYHNVCYPVTADFRAKLVRAVLDGYEAAIEKMWDMLDAAENLRKANAFPEHPHVPGEQPEDGAI